MIEVSERVQEQPAVPHGAYTASYAPRKNSRLFDRAVSALSNLLAAEGLESANLAAAEALREPKRADYAESIKARSSEPYNALAKFFRIQNARRFSVGRTPAGDHEQCWYADGKPIRLTSEPYELDWQSIQEIVQFCQKHGLEAHMSGASWHYPGRTFLVEFYRPDEESRHLDQEVI